MLTLIPVQATACVSWRRESVPEAGTREASQLPSRVRVVTAAGGERTIWYPEILKDTLVGVAGRGRSREDTTTIRVAVADIRRPEVRRPSLMRSTILVAGIVAAGILCNATSCVDVGP